MKGRSRRALARCDGKCRASRTAGPAHRPRPLAPLLVASVCLALYPALGAVSGTGGEAAARLASTGPALVPTGAARPALAAVVAAVARRPASSASGPTAVPAIAGVAQQYAVLGRAACVDCHEPDGRHEVEYEWLRERDGSSPGTQHINAFNQLYDNEAESRRFVEALLPSVGNGWEEAMLYDASIGCMRCHATVVGGEPIDGVACEGCHGPGSGYNEIHKERGAYQRAVDEGGMRDLIGKPENWSKVCMDCHVMEDSTLIAAGHPSGDEFDLGEKYQPVSLHFIKSRGAYSAAQISGLGRQWLAAIQGRREPVAGAAPAATPEPQPEQPEPETPPAAQPATTTPTTPAKTTPAREPASPPVTASRLPPSTAPTPRAPVVDPLLGRALGAVDAGAPEALPRTPTGVVAAIQGRVVTLLAELLNRGASSPVRIVPEQEMPAYSGADAELLRLQQEVIALALEALRVAPSRQQ